MARRPPSWNRHRARFAGVVRARPRRRLGRFRFGVLVAAGFALVFVLTLSWPLNGPVEQTSVQVAATVVPPARSRGDLRCEVAHVTDGDTFRCRDGTRIRLHAVAARESDGTCSPGHPCPTASAEAATSELRRLVGGRTVSCEAIGRSYDRTTAVCWTPEDIEVNCAMIQSGTTLIWDRFARQAPVCRTDSQV